MNITVYKPRPDISENAAERIDIELPDEEIVKIGKQCVELIKTAIPLLHSMYSAIDEKGDLKINQC